ncbi:P22 coat protein-gene protein 5 [Saccharopolyspora kobensis]|uniref:p22 Coat protein-gene protein 5 n=1 Tax=Saccharopolyspora kobensis TaxID=146035 RepID=A0A1H6EPU6_9PSEU|nr:P22 phage major capsid protein family protein [Saccharopolyspora kobensis]SEG98839.1 P22 coat protein-gene protein 5 [Saccharopolyspora kobensis]SFD22992.1 P22 coat protein-gene protein 5 [Saccharopolyspora kobensis]
MAITSFIPEIWNAQLLLDFREQTVAAALTNREYEGNATAGNTVRINTAAAVAVKDYKAANRTTSADAVSTTSQDLPIDQEKNFDFYVDDIDKAQAAGSMDAFTRSAGEGLAEDADKFILSTAVTSAGTVLPSANLTPATAFDVIRDLRKALSKAKVPLANRVLIVNAEFEAILLSSDAKLTNVDQSGSSEGLRNASLGRLLGFDIYTSENLPTVAAPQALAFYRPSVAYVSQVEKTEAMRAVDKFADRLRGLHVYGTKVIRPTGVAVFTDTTA